MANYLLAKQERVRKQLRKGFFDESKSDLSQGDVRCEDEEHAAPGGEAQQADNFQTMLERYRQSLHIPLYPEFDKIWF